MVAEVRRGTSQRQVARRYGVSLSTVQMWIKRAANTRLDRVDFSDHGSAPAVVANKTSIELELRIIELRDELRLNSDLGEYGAEAIHRALVEGNEPLVPTVRTINRVLERYGKFDEHHRIRRPAPHLGWSVPEVAAHRAELDEIDIIEGLLIKDGPEVEVLTLVSLHGGLIRCWPQEAGIKATTVVSALVAHWREFGLPGYAQFDNDTRFQGPHQHPDVISRVMRLCLSLGVTPVFAPPRETGFQAAIESLNGRWQQKVWARFTHASVVALQQQSQSYERASHQRHARRIDAAPARRRFPESWRLDLQQQPEGIVIFLRRSGEHGEITVLGHRYQPDAAWVHRLVRCEVDLTAGLIRFYALRRSEPTIHRLLGEVEYHLPRKRFRE